MKLLNSFITIAALTMGASLALANQPYKILAHHESSSPGTIIKFNDINRSMHTRLQNLVRALKYENEENLAIEKTFAINVVDDQNGIVDQPIELSGYSIIKIYNQTDKDQQYNVKIKMCLVDRNQVDNQVCGEGEDIIELSAHSKFNAIRHPSLEKIISTAGGYWATVTTTVTNSDKQIAFQTSDASLVDVVDDDSL